VKPSTPSWWYAKRSLLPVLLTPAALLWNAVTRARWAFAKPYRSRMPVICIGNFTAGGAGKTPAAIAIAQIMIGSGEHPVFLTRGYGGRTQGPHLVDPSHDTALNVGDEPLLLARVAPTIVSADRAEGARLAEQQDASVIIMDDGFQNPGLIKSASLIVIDGALGLGNEHVIPAGPLRASLGFQLEQANGIILVGEGDAVERITAMARGASLPILSAELAPDRDNAWLKDKPLVAFAGIGNPDKFFHLVEDLDGRIAARIAYGDHHPYTRQDALKLLDLAKRHDAQLVTTQKDIVRIEGEGDLQKLKDASRALPVSMQFKDMGKVKQELALALKTI
jgi:tetraacyldisaccharide 4'-kinase